MKTERQRMLAGELYDPLDPELSAARERARDLCQALNRTREAEHEERRRILRELFGAGGDSAWIQPPFYCDYGSNEIGSDVWIGAGALVLPGVRIGSRAVVGAGSVVTRDIPEGVFAAGNPCRVVREIERGV